MVDGWIRTTGVRYFSELTNMAILTEEVGEVARLMSRKYGISLLKSRIRERNCRMSWRMCCGVVCIANQTGTDLEVALEKNFEKKNMRNATRHRRMRS